MTYDLLRAALVTAATVATPLVLVVLVVGLVTAMVQAATQLQDNVLSFAPKLIATGVVLIFLGHWLLDRLGGFTRSAFALTVRIGMEASK